MTTEAISKLNHHRAGIIERCMDMLADVPGKSLEDRLTTYIGAYMGLQIEVGKQRVALQEAAERLEARGHKFGAEQARGAMAENVLTLPVVRIER